MNLIPLEFLLYYSSLLFVSLSLLLSSSFSLSLPLYPFHLTSYPSPFHVSLSMSLIFLSSISLSDPFPLSILLVVYMWYVEALFVSLCDGPKFQDNRSEEFCICLRSLPPSGYFCFMCLGAEGDMFYVLMAWVVVTFVCLFVCCYEM